MNETTFIGTVREMLLSKKFLASVAGVVVAAAGRIGMDLPLEDVASILSPIMAYILGQGLADIGKHTNLN